MNNAFPDKPAIQSRTAVCLKCGRPIRYCILAARSDGGKDKIIACSNCGYSFTVADKVNETLERNRPEKVQGFIWL